MLKRWELEEKMLLGWNDRTLKFFPFDSQLRQSQTELEKVQEATENFKKMM